MATAPPLVWMDLEMTGLDPDREGILEIACLVTDSDLNVVAEGPHLAVFQPETLLDAMDEWNQTHHRDSGLLTRVRQSTVDTQQAEGLLLEFLQAHVPEGKSPLCGNTIYQDRRFLTRHMPRVERYLHYRLVDVSSVKELALRWYPDLPPFQKAEKHLALDDIRESIGELAYYRNTVFASPARSSPPL